MAIYRVVTKCLKKHPLFIRDGQHYFCKICGDIDIIKLRTIIDNRIINMKAVWKRLK